MMQTENLARPGQLGRLAQACVSPETTALFAAGRKVSFARGDPLIRDGDSAEHVFDVLQGELLMARHGADGRRQVLAFVGPSNVVGLVPGPRYAFACVALTDGFAMRYERRMLEAALRADPDFSAAMRRTLELILESAQDHLFALGQRSAVERVAAFLLQQRLWQARFGPDGPRAPQARIGLPMTRTDIADFMGLTIETVSRAFTKLRQQGAIRLEGPHVAEIIDLALLRRLAGAADFATNPDGPTRGA
jgi:CRP/FNR family transcriptional regulator, anaerobic regulatory protein